MKNLCAPALIGPKYKWDNIEYESKELWSKKKKKKWSPQDREQPKELHED